MANLLNSYTAKSGVYINEDTYTLNDGQKVSFYCPHKHVKVNGIISSDLAINIVQTWENFLSGKGNFVSSLISPLLNTVNTATQIMESKTITQPWFSRKTWNSTTPFSFEIPMTFIAQDNAESDVWKPTLHLASLMYPRQSSTSSKTDTAFGNTSSLKTINGEYSQKGESVANFLNQIGSKYVIPGPSPWYSSTDLESDSDSKGDPVQITIGKLGTFSQCYLESMSIKLSSQMDSNGFPLTSNVTVKITSMDVNTTDDYGEFSFFTDYNFKTLSKASSSVQNLYSLGTDVVNTATTNTIRTLLGEQWTGAQVK